MFVITVVKFSDLISGTGSSIALKSSTISLGGSIKDSMNTSTNVLWMLAFSCIFKAAQC